MNNIFKKSLASLLCALLLLSLLPLVAAPGQMVTGVSVMADRTSAYVGDTVRFAAIHLVGVSNPDHVRYQFTPYMGSIGGSSMFHHELGISYNPTVDFKLWRTG